MVTTTQKSITLKPVTRIVTKTTHTQKYQSITILGPTQKVTGNAPHWVYTSQTGKGTTQQLLVTPQLPWQKVFQNTRGLANFTGTQSVSRSASTVSVAGEKTFTISFWCKRGTTGTAQTVIGFGSTAGPTSDMAWSFQPGNTIIWQTWNSSGLANGSVASTTTLTDTASWHNICIVVDTTQATSTNRVKMYIDGTEVTYNTGANSFPTQNTACMTGTTWYWGRLGYQATNFYHGSLDECIYVDGFALDPTYFMAGTAGGTIGIINFFTTTSSFANGSCWLRFEDNTSTSTLGTDSSGLGNSWTLNSFANTDATTDCPRSFVTWSMLFQLLSLTSGGGFITPQTLALTMTRRKTFSLVQTQLLTLFRAINKRVNTTHTQLATLLRSFAKTSTMTQTQLVTVLRATQKIVSVVQTQLITAARSINKIVSMVETQLLTVIKPAGKIVSMTQTQLVTLTRSTAKLLSMVETQALTLARSTGKRLLMVQVALQLITAASTGTINNKAVNLFSTQLLSLRRTTNKLVSVYSGQLVLLSRAVNKIVSLLTSESLALIRASQRKIALVSPQQVIFSAAKLLTTQLLVSLFSAQRMLALTNLRQGKLILSRHSFGVTGVMGINKRKTAVTGKGTSEKVTLQSGRVKTFQLSQSQLASVTKAHRFALRLTQGIGQALAATLRPSVKIITVYTSQLVPRMTWLIKLASFTQTPQTPEKMTAAVVEPHDIIVTMANTFKTFGVLAIQPLRSAVTGRGIREIVSTTRTYVPTAGIHVIINLYQTQFLPTIGMLFGATQNTETMQSPLRQFLTAVKRSATQTDVLVTLQNAQQVAVTFSLTIGRTILVFTQNTTQTMGLLFSAPQKQLSLTSTQLASKTATYVQRATASVTALLSSPLVITVNQTVTKIIPLMIVQNLMPSMGQLFRATVQTFTMATRQIASVVPNPTGILNTKNVSLVSTQSMRLIRTTAKLLAMIQTDIATAKVPAVKLLMTQVGQQILMNFTYPSRVLVRTTQRLTAGPEHAKRVLISVFGPSQKMIFNAARRVAIQVLQMTTTREVVTVIERTSRVWQLPLQLLQPWLLRMHLVRRSSIRSASKLIVCDTSFGSDEVLRQFKTPSYAPVYQSEAANCVFECGTDLNVHSAILLTIRRPDSTIYQVVGPTYSLYVGNHDLQTDEGIVFAESYILYVSEVGEFYLPGVYQVIVSIPPFVGDPGYFTISPTPPYGTVPTPSTTDTRDVQGS